MKYLLAEMLLCAIMMCTACHNKTTHIEVEHEHEESSSISIYGNDIEIFAELSPLIVGQESHILAHLTNLDSFKPFEIANMSAILDLAGHKDSQALESDKSRPGIYEFHLTPASAGKGSITFIIGDESYSAEVSAYDEEDEAIEAAHSAEPNSANGVRYAKEQSWKTDFQTQPVLKEAFGQVIKTVGKVLPSQKHSIEISAKAPGIIALGAINILPGTKVEKGQILFEVESSSLPGSNMELNFTQARNDYYRTKDEYERKQKLAVDMIVSQSELSLAKSEFEKAQALYKSLEKDFQNGIHRVYSPINGYVSETSITNGQYVQAGQKLATITSGNSVLVEAQLSPKWSEYLDNIIDATFLAKGQKEAQSLSVLSGRLVSVAKLIPSGSTKLPVTFELQDAKGYVPGTFVDVYIKTASKTDQVVTVPCGAILEEMGNYFVFKQLTPEFFEKVQVLIGGTDGKRTEIIGGLSGDERIVSKGAVLLKMAQASGSLDAHSGHVH